MLRGVQVSKGIVLAAGDGDRLGSLTSNCPKVLLPRGNKEPLITYPIRALAAAGIRKIVIVVGYLADRIMQDLGNGSSLGVELHYVINSDYLSGNAISVWKAKEQLRGESAVLCMGDHLIEEELVRRLVESNPSNETLCIDYTPSQNCKIKEATKVTVDITGCIKSIGKELTYWDALDTGVFLINHRFFKAIEELVHYQGTDIETADVIRFLVNRGHLFNTFDVSGSFWMDVDTEEDLVLARSV